MNTQRSLSLVLLFFCLLRPKQLHAATRSHNQVTPHVALVELSQERVNKITHQVARAIAELLDAGAITGEQAEKTEISLRNAALEHARFKAEQGISPIALDGDKKVRTADTFSEPVSAERKYDSSLEEGNVDVAIFTAIQSLMNKSQRLMKVFVYDAVGNPAAFISQELFDRLCAAECSVVPEGDDVEGHDKVPVVSQWQAWADMYAKNEIAEIIFPNFGYTAEYVLENPKIMEKCMQQMNSFYKDPKGFRIRDLDPKRMCTLLQLSFCMGANKFFEALVQALEGYIERSRAHVFTDAYPEIMSMYKDRNFTTLLGKDGALVVRELMKPIPAPAPQPARKQVDQDSWCVVQ